MENRHQNLILRKFTSKDEASFLAACNFWDSSSGFLFAQGFEQGMDFASYLDLLDANEKGERLPFGYVSATVLCAFVGDDLVGRLTIRHTLNEFLLKVGGHIGYGVVPGFRRKGYAKSMLALSLPIAKSLGINQVLVTCDDDNVGSIKTIESCGGRLENKVEVAEGKPLKRRYWIHI